MTRAPKRPHDPNQLAHMIVQIATGEAEQALAPLAGKNLAAVESGPSRRAGGEARAAALTSERRAATRKAAAARWKPKSA